MTVRIETLTFEAVLGILPHERQSPQRLVVDATFTYDYRPGRFVDYADVADAIRTTIRTGRFGLIEEALEATFRTVAEKFPAIATLHLTICKPDILPDCRVCVEERRDLL